MSELLVGGVIVAAASLVGGTTGFGYGLVATPLLLLAGFSLPFVVTANLAVSLVTRASVVYRLRRLVHRRRSSLLIVGSVPGLYVGTRLLANTDPRLLELVVGVVVMALAVGLWLASDIGEDRRRSSAATSLAAGLAGGILGTLTSLNGVVPALFLTHARTAPRSFVADLAAYFVVSNAIGLGLLAVAGQLSTAALLPAVLVWLPGSLAANAVGIAIGPRLPREGFRGLVLALVVVAGAVTVVRAS